MNIEITEDRARWRWADYTWNVRIDGVLIAVAKTPGAGDYVANEVIARNDVAMLKQAISALDAVDQALTAELMRMPEGDYLDANGMRVPAPVHCQQPDDLCDVHNPCPAHAADAAAYLAELAHPSNSLTIPINAEGPECPCGMPALFFVQYPGKTYAYCPDCYRDLNAGRPPLLAQCAAVIRRCLGSTTGAGSIIDELRRVDRALSSEGW